MIIPCLIGRIEKAFLYGIAKNRYSAGLKSKKRYGSYSVGGEDCVGWIRSTHVFVGKFDEYISDINRMMSRSQYHTRIGFGSCIRVKITLDNLRTDTVMHQLFVDVVNQDMDAYCILQDVLEDQ